ncbi:MAG: UPF0280 family protein [Thermodesulfobacteriota bacterium]|nr:UPF0280 family protein [Thermodesulfobacteriota bacterium]
MTTRGYEDRTYRSLVTDDRLESFRVVVKETDLLVRAQRPLVTETRDLVLKHRLPLERYMADHPEFVNQLTPCPCDSIAPPIVKTMVGAGQKAGIGPMGAVAGTVAEYVGKDLLDYSTDVIVENGGDLFIKTDFPLTVAILAGASPLSGKIGVCVHSEQSPVGVCTSSGTVGHSLSFGRADAAVAISESAAVADAAATAIGNVVSNKAAISDAMDFGGSIQGVSGVVVVVEDKMGIWGDVELVRLG